MGNHIVGACEVSGLGLAATGALAGYSEAAIMSAVWVGSSFSGRKAWFSSPETRPPCETPLWQRFLVALTHPMGYGS